MGLYVNSWLRSGNYGNTNANNTRNVYNLHPTSGDYNNDNTNNANAVRPALHSLAQKRIKKASFPVFDMSKDN